MFGFSICSDKVLYDIVYFSMLTSFGHISVHFIAGHSHKFVIESPKTYSNAEYEVRSQSRDVGIIQSFITEYNSNVDNKQQIYLSSIKFVFA